MLLILAACSSSLFYNRIDTVARWYIGNLVTLDETQQASLSDWLERALAWHRGTELKRYQQFLNDLSARIASGPDAAIFPATLSQAEVFRGELSGRLAPEAADLMLTLKPQQVSELFRNLEEHDTEELDEERERTDAERQKRRTAGLTKAMERWTGSATPEQKAIIQRTVSEMIAAHLLGENDEWLASRQAWRAEVGKALAAGKQGKPRLEALLSEPEKTYTAAHRAAQTAERREFLDLVTELDTTLTDKQRATLARKITELATDLGTLARPS